MSSSVSHTIMWTKARKPFHGMEIQFLRTTGNFRLLHRLLTQIARIVGINALQAVTSEVVEAARESLVIGTS